MVKTLLLLAPDQTITVTLSPSQAAKAVDGRLLVLFSTEENGEPRFQISDGPKTQAVFGQDVENWKPGTPVKLDQAAAGYPVTSLRELKPGQYRAQAVLDLHETYRLPGGRVLKLPADRGEGRQWNRAPGNWYSKPLKVKVAPGASITLSLDQAMPPIEPPKDTPYIRHIRIQREMLTRFWGRPMYLGAHVLLPKGFGWRY